MCLAGAPHGPQSQGMFESSDTIPILLAIIGIGGVLAGMA